MQTNNVVSRTAWTEARKQHLAREKDFDRQRDELARERRALPWVKVEGDYRFDDVEGPVSLADLFRERSQLIVYHFMFHADWEEGCPSCSYWADNFDRIITHLNQRDVSMVAISKAPIDKIDSFKKRMGWSFQWLSSFGNDFNRDFHVSFTPEEVEKGEMTYNYATRSFPSPEAPGVSVFARDASGAVYHTYSTYARGLDKLNAAYHYLDIVPKGRDEDGLPFTQAWVRHHDKYDAG